jgi:hypothetical protein
MPRICEFYGIVIGMYYSEHGVPHFHAEFGGAEASFAIAELEFLEGSLPRASARRVREWAALHQSELMDNWRRARTAEVLLPIEPL